MNFRNITNNKDNDDDFDFDLVKTTMTNKNSPSLPIRRYPLRTRNRPTFCHELTGRRKKKKNEGEEENVIV